MNDLKVLDKVKALLSKTTENGASEAEAQSAFLKAQELLVKHGLSMEDTENYNPSMAQIVQAKGSSKEYQKFRWPLAKVVAANFRCERFKRGKDVWFIGREEDAAICREVYNAAYEFIHREAWRRQRKIYAETGTGKDIVNAYALGFIKGLKNAFDVQCQALIVVVPPEVTEALNEVAKSKSKFSFKLAVTDHTNTARRAGYHDGQTFMNGARVGNAE